eukprot:9742413-Lingulodinium_polyedra.AAC.1
MAFGYMVCWAFGRVSRTCYIWPLAGSGPKAAFDLQRLGANYNKTHLWCTCDHTLLSEGRYCGEAWFGERGHRRLGSRSAKSRSVE